MKWFREYLIIEVYIAGSLAFLIIILVIFLISGNKVDFGDLELSGLFTFVSSVGTLAAAIAAWKAVTITENTQRVQQKEIAESFLPLFEVVGKGTGEHFTNFTLYNRNPKPISITNTGSNSEKGHEFTKRAVDEFNVFIFGDFQEHDAVSLWIYYKTLDRKNYVEEISLRIVDNNAVIENQKYKLI